MRAVAAAVGIVGALLLAGCASTGPRPSTQYTTPPETTGGLSMESPVVEQVALARSSNDLLSIFPARPGTTTCRIPAGGHRVKPWPATCTTRVRRARTHEPALLVSFTETWGPAPCPPGAFCPVMLPQHHTWTVVEGEPVVTAGSRLRVLATRQSGATAPQFYK
ncbi:MAG TPA: hypothetical protein VGH79_04180 [Gaiellaceae bacterium]